MLALIFDGLLYILEYKFGSVVKLLKRSFKNVQGVQSNQIRPWWQIIRKYSKYINKLRYCCVIVYPSFITLVDFWQAATDVQCIESYINNKKIILKSFIIFSFKKIKINQINESKENF